MLTLCKHTQQRKPLMREHGERGTTAALERLQTGTIHILRCSHNTVCQRETCTAFSSTACSTVWAQSREGRGHYTPCPPTPRLLCNEGRNVLPVHQDGEHAPRTPASPSRSFSRYRMLTSPSSSRKRLRRCPAGRSPLPGLPRLEGRRLQLLAEGVQLVAPGCSSGGGS